MCHSPSNPSQLMAFEHLIQISETFKPVSYSLWQSVHCWKMNDRESPLWNCCILVLCIIKNFDFFTLFFSRKRVKSEMLSLISRMKSEMKMPWNRDREWKVKWKGLESEIENEKWNENASRSRSRSEMTTKFSRILEKRDSRRLLQLIIINIIN